MSETHSSRDDGMRGDGMSHGAMLRCAADGELSPGQRAALESLLARSPEDERRIAFERELRARVGAVMGSEGAAPAEVVSAVREILAGERAAGVAGTIGGGSRRRGWIGWVAAAAVVAVAGGMILHPASPVSPLHQGGVVEFDGPRKAALVRFVESQHDNCETLREYFDRKMRISDLTETESAIASALGARPGPLSLDGAGYEFVGAGRCAVPGGGESMHLMYRAAGGEGEAVSVFVQRDTGRLPLDAGKCYALEHRTPGRGPLVMWRADGLIYYMLGPAADSSGELRAMLGGPASAPQVL